MTRTKTIQKLTFKPDVDLEQAEGTLLLSIIAAEALHGQAAVRLEARYLFSNEKRACVIECRGKVSDDVIKIFTGFLIHEFGEDAFQVTLISKDDHVERPAPGNAKPTSGGRGNGGCNGCETNVCAACGKVVA